jgi:TPR repeat protein
VGAADWHMKHAIFLASLLLAIGVACQAQPVAEIATKANNGDPDAVGVRSVLLQWSSIPALEGKSKNEESLRLANQSEKAGSPFGQYALGRIYREGVGVEKDSNKSQKLYKSAFPRLLELAKNGDAYAQNFVGASYSEGRGTEKDNAQAMIWFRKSAEQGNAFGQGVLGWFYANGKGVEKDPAEAVKWFRKSAEQGNKGAMQSLDDFSQWSFTTIKP